MTTPLLTRLPSIQTPPELHDRVMDAIVAVQIRRVRFRFGSMLAGAVGSIALTVAYHAALWEEITTSSFFSTLRLVASDPDVAFGNAKEFALGLLETLPLGTITLALVGLFCIVGAVGFAQALRKTRRLFPMQHPIHS